METGPLAFEPIFKAKMWGGRRLEQLFAKPLPRGELIGESWELADLPGDESAIREGPHKGRRIGELVAAQADALLGRARPVRGRFPLLIKFLDANRDLSVQVHPTREMAAADPEAHVKNEAWYVVAADPGATIYHGLNPGVTRDQLTAALASGDVAPLLRRIPARPGDCHYLPSGTVHALGAGVVVAEVQTPSDTTYRLFDWNRIDEATGRPRELHIEQAMRCIDFDARPPVRPTERAYGAGTWPGAVRIARCEHFTIDRVSLTPGGRQDIQMDEMAVWIVIEGELALSCGGVGGNLTARAGDTVLLPAAMRKWELRVIRPSVWLDVRIPEEASL